MARALELVPGPCWQKPGHSFVTGVLSTPLTVTAEVVGKHRRAQSLPEINVPRAVAVSEHVCTCLFLTKLRKLKMPFQKS